VKVLALDHGAARTGVAVSDKTATLARPLTVVERVGTDAGFSALLAVIEAEDAQCIVVGLPVSLDGSENAQARLARAFSERLAAAVDVPVDLYDERFTSRLADRRGGSASRDARAAATLLEDYLRKMDGQIR